MESQGGVTGGATISEFTEAYRLQGYVTDFFVRPEGALECQACHARLRGSEVGLHSIRRVEGASDPDDMGAVGAVECPRCGARGTATFCVGSHCPPEHGEVLRSLRNERDALHHRAHAEDASVAYDSGWLPGPDGGRP